MKSQFRDELPEKVVREGDCSYFLYHDSFDSASKVSVYHKYTKVLQVSVDTHLKQVRCMSSSGVTYADLWHVERLLKGILPEEVLLLEILQDALKSRDGVVEVNY